MATDVFSRDRAATDVKLTTLPTQSTDTNDIAERAWSWALESCADRMGLDGSEAVAEQMRQGNDLVRMHCCHGLAEQVAASLRSSYQDIQAVYAPDCNTCPQGFCADERVLQTPFVHLLVWAQHKTPALSSRTAALGNALARVGQGIVGTRELPNLLYARVIDNADLEKLFGAGRRERWPIRLQAYLLAMNEPSEEL
jgi:hypothetical protein